MRWRTCGSNPTQGLADIAHHVAGCRVTEEKKLKRNEGIRNAFL
jgi:hypothetical protein